MQRGNRKNRVLDLYAGTPLLNLLATFRRRRKPPANLQRIGVMCSPALGDTLLFSAALQDVRAAFPAAHITHLCMKENLAAAEIIPGASDRLLISLAQPASSVSAIRSQRFDVLLDFTGWQRISALYTLLSGASYTVGFNGLGMRRHRGYDRIVPHSRERHELENFRALVSGSSIIPAAAIGHAPAVCIPPGPTPFAEERTIFIFHPWASGQNAALREWPLERWIELAQTIATPDALFLVTGGPSDRPRAEPFVAALTAAGLRAQTFVSPDGFISLTRLLRHARAVISVNTGVMHLAAIAGAATVSLNGPTAEHRWGARGPNVANVQPADGSGGYLHFGFEFENQPHDVMLRITVGQVAEAVHTVVSQASPAGAF